MTMLNDLGIIALEEENNLKNKFGFLKKRQSDLDWEYKGTRYTKQTEVTKIKNGKVQKLVRVSFSLKI